jgi:hypothetical protein
VEGTSGEDATLIAPDKPLVNQPDHPHLETTECGGQVALDRQPQLVSEVAYAVVDATQTTVNCYEPRVDCRKMRVDRRKSGIDQSETPVN